MPFNITILGIATGIASFFLGGYVFFKNPRQTTNISFGLYGILTGLWAFALYFYVNPIWFSNDLWIKIVYAIVVVFMIPITHFIYHFPRDDKYSKRTWPHITIYSFVGLVFLYLLFFTDSWVKSVTATVHGPETVLGPIYQWWGMFMGINAMFIFYPLWPRWKKSRGIERAQLKFFTLGIALMAVGTMFLDVFIPLVLGTTEFFWASSLFALILVGFTSYAMIKHRFLDIRLAVRTNLIRLLTVLFLCLLFYLVGVSFLNGWIQLTQRGVVLTAIGLAVLVFALYRPIERIFQRSTDKLFFQDEYQRQRLLRDLSKEISESIELDNLESKISQTLQKTMDVSWVRFEIGDDTQYRTVREFIQSSPQVIVADELIHWIDQANEPKSKDQLIQIQQLMENEEIDVILPLISSDKVVGISLIGERQDKNAFSNTDLAILETLVYQAGTAIEKAWLLAETKNFNATLQKEVDKATADLRKAYEELKQLDKMKDELVSVASHELRTPITIIKELLWMVINRQSEGLDPKVLKNITRSYDSAERMIELVNDILTVSEIEGGKIEMHQEPQQIEPLVEQVVSDMSVKAQNKKVEIVLDKTTDLPEVAIDADRIREVLTNLVDNAIKYSPEAGKVQVSLRRNEQMIEVSVKDQGKGIDEESKQRLFQKFSRLEGSFVSSAEAGGTGLGLYISKIIVEMHGGNIWVESVEGQGSTFVFSLPVADDVSKVSQSKAKNATSLFSE